VAPSYVQTPEITAALAADALPTGCATSWPGPSS